MTLLKQAMLHDPLTGAVCDPEEIWQMTDEMLIAQAAVAATVRVGDPRGCRRGLAAAVAAGTRVHRMEGFQGAARLHTKTVAEMAEAKEEARNNAQAADKGKMTTNA